MDTEFITLRAGSPVRPPDWRTRLAAALHDDRLAFVASRKKDVPDALVRKLLTHRFGWNWDAATPDEWAQIQAAERWHAAASADDLLTVQTRLLAGETDAAIGATVGLPADVVGCVELLYFNCRDRLKCRSFIRNQLLGDPVWPTVETVLRTAAYYGGPVALDAAVLAHRETRLDAPRPTPTTAAEFDDAIVRARRRCRWTAALVSPLDLAAPAVRKIVEVGHAPAAGFGHLRLPAATWSIHPKASAANVIQHDSRVAETVDPPECVQIRAGTCGARKQYSGIDLSSAVRMRYARPTVECGIRGVLFEHERNILCNSHELQPTDRLLPASSGGPVEMGNEKSLADLSGDETRSLGPIRAPGHATGPAGSTRPADVRLVAIVCG